MTRQLALPFAGVARYRAADFLESEASAEALAWLSRPELWPGLRLAVHGEAGSGKTHLLHVFAERHGALLMPGEAVRHLIDLPAVGGIAVDDADTAPEPEALLHLLNAAAEAGLPVLLAGLYAPCPLEHGFAGSGQPVAGDHSRGTWTSERRVAARAAGTPDR